MNVFSIDGPLMRFLNLIANIITLHFMWLLYSLPVFTIGASTTALYYSCMKLIRTGEGYVHANFHKAFKENFRQSTIIWIALLLIGCIFITDIRFSLYLNNTMGKIMLTGCSLFLIPFILVCLYIFPIQAKFENRIFANIKNALLMSLRHFLLSLTLLFILGTLIFLGLFFRPFMGFMLFCGAGLIGYLTSNIFIMVFRKYLPDEIADDLERSGETFQ